MSKTVKFNGKLIEKAAEIAPGYTFSSFAQMAVRNEIDRRIKSIPGITEEIMQRLTAETAGR